MPQDKATWDKPFLKDAKTLHLAAFINDDRLHKRPGISSADYPIISEKAIDYSIGPFVDSFSEMQHKYGPYKPIIDYYKEKGLKAVY